MASLTALLLWSLAALAEFTPDLKSAKIDLPATFDDRFAKKAAQTTK